MYDIIELSKIALPFIVPSAFAALYGLAPRLGPGRALWLIVRTRFTFKSLPESIRYKEIKQIKEFISSKTFEQKYLGIGIGKSCLLETCANKSSGIVNVLVFPEDNMNDIVKSTLQSLINLPYFFPPHQSAKRVIFWYKVFTFGNTPTIIINAIERRNGKESSSLTCAVTTLIDEYKLKLIIDDSFDESLLYSEQADVIELKPMSKEMIWSLPQLKELLMIIDKTEKFGMIVYSVLGGVPVHYEYIWSQYNLSRLSKDFTNDKQLIEDILCGIIYSAIQLVLDSQYKPGMKEIIKLFDKEMNGIYRDKLLEKDLTLPINDRIFHKVERNGRFTLVPASNAIGIVLRNDLSMMPRYECLEQLVLQDNYVNESAEKEFVYGK
eukprot:gene18168-23826_t